MEFLVERKKVSTALGKSNLPGLDYTLNPYVGCSHGCVYCYARLYCDLRIAENWGKIVVVKENIAEVLAKEITRKRKGVVGLSTITDAYQSIEAKERIARELLMMLLENNFEVSIQTKSSLVLRDLDILCEKKELVDVGFTITTLDKRIAEVVEPKAPSPSDRVKALEKISAEGIKTWIFLGPIIPGISEESFGEIVEIAKATNSLVYYDRYRVKPFMSGIAKELAEKAMKTDWKRVFEKIEQLCEKKGVFTKSAFD
ncbi:MAG: radical SAM protein [Archaeoglobaceae archaeon]